MGKKIVLVDTNVFVGSFRGDQTSINKLELLRGRIGISIVTSMELFQGCDEKKIKELSKQLSAYNLIVASSDTMRIALGLIKSYRRYGLKVVDAIIAASAIENNLELETFNKKDFNFIKGIRFFGGKKFT